MVPLTVIGQGETMARVNANGIEIAFETTGPETAPAILLTRGLGTQMIDWPAAFWQGMVEHGYRVVRYDNRDAGLGQKFGPCEAPPEGEGGAGRAPARRAAYDLFDMADDAVGLLDGLGIERAHILGISMGGMISQIVAARYPERTASLISTRFPDRRRRSRLSASPGRRPPIARPSSPGGCATTGCSAAEATRRTPIARATARRPGWSAVIALAACCASARRYRPPVRVRRCCAASPAQLW
jgi:pimeloyl-ACP methyl ester carboxylesterase